MEYRGETILKGFDKYNGVINYKWLTTIFLCTTITFAVLIVTNIDDSKLNDIREKKELLEKKIDSLEIIIMDNNLNIKYLKEQRIPVENRISERDGTLVKLKEQKDESFKVILNDSADTDLRELDTLLTELVEEYEIR